MRQGIPEEKSKMKKEPKDPNNLGQISYPHSLQTRKTIENLQEDQEILMISQWKHQFLQGAPDDQAEKEVALVESDLQQNRHPLRVSNTNRPHLKPHRLGPLQDRKRAYSAPTEVQGHLLIRAGAVSRQPAMHNENMIPPGKKKMRVQEPGGLQGTENDQKHLLPKKRSAEKYQLRQSPRPKVRH
jgi:hypothetical protein